MAAHPVVTVGDGVIQIPEDLRHDPRFQKGARLELVPVEVETTSAASIPKGDWRRLRGLLRDPEVNLNDQLKKDRLAELAADERMLNGSSSSE